MKTLIDAGGDHLSHRSAIDLIKEWFSDSDIARGKADAWSDDEAFYTWKNDSKNYEKKLQELGVQKVLLQLTNIGNSTSDLQALPQGLATLLSKVKYSIILSCYHFIIFSPNLGFLIF